MLEITIQVPDEMADRLQRYRERLPEVLERGLRDVMAEDVRPFGDENVVLEVLANQPSPQQILGLQPSSEMQARVSMLLDKSKEGGLSSQEEAELERYLVVEHLVRLAKAHAYRQIAS
jgi:hypothetical protein